MKQHLFIALLFLSACSDRKKSVPTIADTDEIRQSPQHIASNQPVHIQSDIFEIANIDYLGNKIQRIFVVISPQNVNDTTIIKQIIDVLTNNNESQIFRFNQKKNTRNTKHRYLQISKICCQRTHIRIGRTTII